MKTKLSFILLLMAAVNLSQADVQPYKPAMPEQIVVTVSQHDDMRKIRILRKQLRQQPDNVEVLDNIITAYKSLGRQNADERYFAYAETVLLPYIESGTDNEILLLHWADILQRRHEFEQSSAVLTRVLNINPDNVNAHVQRALMYQVRGQYDLAMKSCRALAGNVESLVLMICITQINSLEGKLSESLAMLQKTLRKNSSSSPAVLSWAQTVLAEMYLRESDYIRAEALMRKVLKADSRDYYARALYADLLIRQQRYQEVVKLLQPYIYVDKLFLRVVIAKKFLQQLDDDSLNQLQSRISRISQFSGDEHYRLLSRYYLDVADDPGNALKLAKKNWVNQREPDDLLLLVRCMIAAGDTVGLQYFNQWIKQQRLQDKRIQLLLPPSLAGAADV